MKHGKPQLLSSSSPSSPESLRQPTSYSSAASKSAAILSLADMEYREDEIRVQEEIRFHKENPNTCEFCKKKCDVNVDMMEKCMWLPMVPILSHNIKFCYDLNRDLWP